MHDSDVFNIYPVESVFDIHHGERGGCSIRVPVPVNKPFESPNCDALPPLDALAPLILIFVKSKMMTTNKREKRKKGKGEK
jgi:hypothetical protein